MEVAVESGVGGARKRGKDGQHISDNVSEQNQNIDKNEIPAHAQYYATYYVIIQRIMLRNIG
jgi:hypothetical protein